MGKTYRDRRDIAKDDANERLSGHYMTEEPVRSYRFHARTTSLSVKKRQEGAYPFLKVYPPTERASFPYTSFYAFTLTWTPGHMTIVGDIGELTVVHYNAMPTLEEACNWLQSPDYDYLLSKTNLKRVFDREGTLAFLWETMTERVAEHEKYLAEEIASWESGKPKWRKRDGMKKDEFEQEMKWWNDDNPRISYGFSECQPPRHRENRNLWSAAERSGWHCPDGFDHLLHAWAFFRDSGYGYGIADDPNTLLTEAGREAVRAAMTRWCHDHSDEEIGSMVYRDLGYEDYSGSYEYPQSAFFQIAAIQYGARMILDRHHPRLEVAA